MTDNARAELAADVAEAEAELDYYDAFLEALRPYMEGTGRTLGDTLRAMPEAEREHVLWLGQVAGALR